MSIPLGSVIPDSVIVDVASFFDETDIREFYLASPRTNTLTDINRLMLKDYETFSVKYDKDMILIDTSWEIYRNHKRISAIRYNVTDASEAREKLTNLLLKCGLIKTLSLTGIDVDDKLIGKLIKTNIRECGMGNCVLEVDIDRFMEFLSLQEVSLREVQISNELITNESMMLLKCASVYRSWKSDCQSFDKTITSLSNEYLRQCMKCSTTRYLDFRGFSNNFTVDCISNYAEGAPGRTDYGILSYKQLSKAIRYRNKNYHQTRLRSWNGHKSIYFHIYNTQSWPDTAETDTVPDVVFSVSLEENGTGPVADVTVPINLVPTKEYALFENFVKVMNGSQFVKTDEASLDNIQSFTVSYTKDDRRRAQLKIKYKIRPVLGICFDKKKIEAEKDMAKPIEHVLVKTDLKLSETYPIIVNILKECRCVTKMEFVGITLTDEFYALLKPVTERIRIKNWWITNFDLNPISFLEISNKIDKIDFKKSHYLSKNWLTNKDLTKFIETQFNITTKQDHTEETNYKNPLNDDFLMLFASGKAELPDRFSFKFCKTEFTAKGISVQEGLITSFLYQNTLVPQVGPATNGLQFKSAVSTNHRKAAANAQLRQINLIVRSLSIHFMLCNTFGILLFCPLVGFVHLRRCISFL